MSKRIPKIHKNSHNTTVVLCWHEKKFGSNKRQWISFRPQRWDVPYRNHDACCEKLWFVRRIYPDLPQTGQNFYHGMLMPPHESMQSFMNFRRVLDLLEFKNLASQCFAGNQRCPGVWNSFPFLAWEPKHLPRVGRSLPKPPCLLWEAPVCEKHIAKPAPNGTKILLRHVDAAPW